MHATRSNARPQSADSLRVYPATPAFAGWSAPPPAAHFAPSFQASARMARPAAARSNLQTRQSLRPDEFRPYHALVRTREISKTSETLECADIGRRGRRRFDGDEERRDLCVLLCVVVLKKTQRHEDPRGTRRAIDLLVEEVRGSGMLGRGPIQAAKRTALALLAGHETARPSRVRTPLTR